MIHELKTRTDFFDAVLSGKKKFEVRKNDRDFRPGDLLALNEFQDGEHTGRSIVVGVDYLLSDPEFVKEGFAVLGIRSCEVAWACSDYDEVPLATARYPKEDR